MAQPIAAAIEPAPVVVVADVATPPVVEAAVEVTPAPAAVAPMEAPVVAAPVVDLSQNLEQAGLVLIETAPDKAQSAPQIVVPSQPLGRKPKPAPVLIDEPLQIVETRRE